ncbi:ABC transporter, substrate-binding protein, aliphatic sulfonates family [Rubidibacter lacunae KORDI 51-2]|uniref:ABC transporter, substrate-binding protein, aliphatic sulfonates family n=1 Tax=Rubidibacter lacunae KORDI 51-2 TaxID=582515 RepID=U5DKP2_9CHRO|nr:ABC transporter substrate-binding protein [Rubidibacter lacunae]ERN41119.1 ABC transporter, substrate-binding protein, aliphatic sulfonates family [Rubidibacter lacunae KORDI 51-2]
MRRNKFFSRCALFLASLMLVASCNSSSEPPAETAPGSESTSASAVDNGPPVVMGYSSWAGWWPWAIAEEEGLFEANGANVELRWFDGYLSSLEAMAAGQLDANCQTLNDTVSFLDAAVKGEVVVLVNDNSFGNDKVIVTDEIDSLEDLLGKQIALEEGVVGDFLLTLALEENGYARSEVDIVNLETGAAAAAFAAEKVDAVAVYAPFYLTALKREGSKELVTSAEFPGAIPDLLVTSQTLIDERPDQVQALVDTWFAVLNFIEQNPERADEIMAKRAEVSVEELQLLKEGTKIFTIEENLEAFSDGDSMANMPFAAERMADFMVSVDFIPEKPDMSRLFDDRFVRNFAERNGD